jgi:hypothetical protein
MSRLLLGPLLRHIGSTDATLWVETEQPCTVEVLGHAEPTWTVAGHHYALVCVDGLEPGSTTPYEVRLDGELVWPPTDSPHPRSAIRTQGGPGPARLVFGSCRWARPAAALGSKRFGPDALDVYATRLARLPEDRWPNQLLLLGDQVYADETSAAVQTRIRARRDIRQPPWGQVADYEEYTWLYHESWTDENIRWLLSTVPTAMIFDDHDVRDDWNTSESWRQDMAATSWWHERIVGGLASYWVYQHLGNLTPEALAADDLYAKVRAADGDAAPLVREFAVAADKEADGRRGARWSFRRDLVSAGTHARLMVVDSRAGRILADDRRGMISDEDFAWLEEQVSGSYDHLLVASSLPWLLPRGMHDVEAWNEILASGSRGARMARYGEWWRRAADLEHWAAFRESFDRLAELIRCVGRGDHAGSGGQPPSTINVLSGDVHHAYVARAEYPDEVRSPVHQLTCSPVHNYVPTVVQKGFRLAWSRWAERTTRFLLNRVAQVPAPPVEWSRVCGPYFGNEIATLTMDGRRALLRLERAGRHGDQSELSPVADLELSHAAR